MDEALLPPVEKPKTFLEIYLFHNFSTKKSRKFFYLKCFLLILLLLLIFSSQAINSSTSRSPKCIEDRIFNLTSSINSYFSSSPSIKNSFVILSSFFLDLNISIFLGIFLLWGDSWREVIFAGSFYSIRGLLQALTILGFPEGFIWEYPGIYSLLITYVRSSDFFYSGHVGMMMFTGIYYYRNHFLGLMWYSVFCCIFEAIVMVLVRCHYSIDIVGALIFCHYFWILSKDFAFYADVLGFRQAREAKGELIDY
jgi:hypothetical protein